MRMTAALLKPQQIHHFFPWRRRPHGLAASAVPQLTNPVHHKTVHKRLNPDDPTGTMPMGHVIVKTCKNCGRAKFFPISERHSFHTCCETFVMKERGSMKTVADRIYKLKNLNRVWDVENERPFSNAARARPKGRSKLKK